MRRAASVRSIEWGRPLRLGRGPTDSRRCASGGGAGAARSHGGGAGGGVERARTGDCQGGLGDCVEPGQDGRALLLLLGGQGRRPGAAASAAATAHVCGAGGRGRARGDHLFLLLDLKSLFREFALVFVEKQLFLRQLSFNVLYLLLFLVQIFLTVYFDFVLQHHLL